MRQGAWIMAAWWAPAPCPGGLGREQGPRSVVGRDHGGGPLVVASMGPVPYARVRASVFLLTRWRRPPVDGHHGGNRKDRGQPPDDGTTGHDLAILTSYRRRARWSAVSRKTTHSSRLNPAWSKISQAVWGRPASHARAAWSRTRRRTDRLVGAGLGPRVVESVWLGHCGFSFLDSPLWTVHRGRYRGRTGKVTM
jgi:hypothetical protein